MFDLVFLLCLNGQYVGIAGAIVVSLGLLGRVPKYSFHLIVDMVIRLRKGRSVKTTHIQEWIFILQHKKTPILL
jgi:hypothetical protein